MLEFDNFDPKIFLRDYWQKKPLFIKNPWNQWRNPLEPDELAGLACEDDIESRLIIQNNDDWNVEHGPLDETRFDTLGKRHWTLLVQAVDHYVSDVSGLIDPFRFIPNWRIDDVMVSFAADQGGVGPHFDQYDVFLIQGLGKRRWQIGSACDEATKLKPNDDLKLLAEFQPTEEWICEPGDILYIPPGISHNGVAVGEECMTYSIGFRAPSRAELLSHWVDEMPADFSDDRYNDPGIQLQDNPGEILPDAIDKLHDITGSNLSKRDDFSEWFGLFNSATKYPDIDWAPEQPMPATEFASELNSGRTLERNPASRFSFIRNGSQMLLLFVDGQMFECKTATVQLAERICEQSRIDQLVDLARSNDAVELLHQLYNQGSLFFDHID